jgi:dTDP-L-rhamnose 4-epimerase
MENTKTLRQQRLLVTGGAGFIGCAISQRLAPGAASYVVVDNLHPQVHATRSRPPALHAAAELVTADVVARSTWDDLFGRFRPTTVIHLAAETGTGQSLTEATRHGSVNVVGTTQLTDALGRHGIDPTHVVLSSSRAIYGEGAWRGMDGALVYPGPRTRQQLEREQWDFPGLVHESSAAGRTHPSPTSVYGATKLAQEHILSAWAGALKVPLSVFRFQNVYGPGQSLTNSYTGIVSLFCRMARSGKSIPVYEDGEITRDFVFIDDVADAIAAAVASPPTGARTCDVGSGVETTVRELANRIASLYGAPAPHVCGKFRDGDVRRASCDIATTVEALGWAPRWSLERGLEALRRWIDEQHPEEA